MHIKLTFETGIEKIQYWTKQSLRTKPFSLAVGKDWTLRPSKTDLREIYTDLSWTRKHRKAYTVEQEDLKNITQILNEEQLGEDGPVRILVQGNYSDLLNFELPFWSSNKYLTVNIVHQKRRGTFSLKLSLTNNSKRQKPWLKCRLQYLTSNSYSDPGRKINKSSLEFFVLSIR